MKAKLEFELPEEREEHSRALYGGDYKAEISDFDNYLRAQIKYGLEPAIQELQIDEDKATLLLQLVRTKLYDICRKALSDE